MTYFGFLLRFLVIPILILLGVALWDKRQGRQMPTFLRMFPLWAAIAVHILVALIYTTPWDNYLVATGVWWYDSDLVTGLTLGWVPIEEYTFFVLQPILAGLWLGFLARRWPVEDTSYQVSPPTGRGNALRLWSTTALGALWLGAVITLLAGWRPGTYLGLELGWALPPIALQLFFGADILWRYRRLVLATLVPLTLYLSATDFLAIGWGTWTIDPQQSLHILLGGVLPLEEFIFFLLTNVLLTFGVVLIMAEPSHERLAALRQRLSLFARPAEERR